jgi:TolB-like protein
MRWSVSTGSIQQIGRELNVAYALEGSVRRASGRTRIARNEFDLDLPRDRLSHVTL